jgi:hypothetical protein
MTTLNRRRARLALVILNAVIIACAIVLWPKEQLEEPLTKLQVDLSQVPGLPKGAVACDVIYGEVTTPFALSARGTPMTSCAFAEQVRLAYAGQTGSAERTRQVKAVSPATRKEYRMSCAPSVAYTTCTGGQGALIYLYNRK